MYKEKKQKSIFLICVFVLSFILSYGWRMASGAIHSDETTCYDMMADFFDGNITLRGWYFSTGLFLLPSTVMYFFVKLFGIGDTALFITSGFNYACLVTGSLYCVYTVLQDREDKERWEILFPVLAGFLVIVPRSSMNLNGGTHVLSVAASILFCYLIFKVLKFKSGKKQIVSLIFIVMCMGILSATNTMFMYTALIPLMITGILYTMEKKEMIAGLPYLFTGVVAVGIQIIFENFWKLARGSEVVIMSQTTFVEGENLWDSLSEGILNGLRMFGIDPWGKELISIFTVQAMIGGIILIKLAKEIIIYLSGKKGKESPLFYFFFTMGLVNIGAFVFSTMALTYRSTHLLFPFLFGICVSGTIGWLVNIRNGKCEKKCVILYLGLSVILMVTMAPGFTLHKPCDYKKDVAEYLIDNGYSNGYGGFWSASSVMYWAQGLNPEQIKIAPMMGGPAGRVLPEPWLTTEEILKQNAEFYICNDDELKSIPEERIRYSFGEWDEKIRIGSINIYLWKKSVSSFGVMGCESYNNSMSVTEAVMKQENGIIRIQQGQSMYGPYLNLSEGNYVLVVEAECNQPITLSVTAMYGTKNLCLTELVNGINVIPVLIDEYTTEVEFICGNGLTEDQSIAIRSIKFGNIENEDFKEYLDSIHN